MNIIKKSWYVAVAMIAGVHVAQANNDMLVKEYAIDDVYKLKMKGKMTYQAFQQQCNDLTTEQIHAQLAGLSAKVLRSVNDERLAVYKHRSDKYLDRASMVGSYDESKSLSVYEKATAYDVKLKLAQQRRAEAKAKLQARAEYYISPAVRFEALKKSYRGNIYAGISGSLAGTALIVFGLKADRGAHDYISAIPTVAGICLLGVVSGAFKRELAIDPAFYFNEKRDHERRAALIEQYARKTS